MSGSASFCVGFKRALLAALVLCVTQGLCGICSPEKGRYRKTMDKNYRALELDKILEMLAQETTCADAAEKAALIAPVHLSLIHI